MREVREQLEEARQALEDVRGNPDQAVQHLIASAARLVRTLERIDAERVWN